MLWELESEFEGLSGLGLAKLFERADALQEQLAAAILVLVQALELERNWAAAAEITTHKAQ